MNSVTLLANLCADPEVRALPSGDNLVKLRLAHSRKGKGEEETLFLDAAAFGKTADTIARFFRKGDQILVQGRLKLDRWESREGQQRSKITMVVGTFSFTRGGTGERTQKQPERPAAQRRDGSLTF